MPRGRRVKIKKIMPKNSPEDTAVLNDMFAQMTGEGNADTSVIIPKFIALNNHLKKYVQIFNLLLSFDDFVKSFPEYDHNFKEISDFMQKVSSSISDNIDEKKLKELSNDDMNKLYKTLKQSGEVQSIVITSGNLKKYKRHLSDRKNLSDEFIKREPGLSFTPLKFTKLDFKMLWSSSKLSNMAKKYILNILSHTFELGHEVYQIITSPDIDIKKFSKVLIKNIETMKKQIPRCNKAFDIIAKSVHLLENNFDGYYKTSVEAENPSIIVESFIIDVSMSQKANASITAQFRKIIMFMKRQAMNNKDPRVAKLFKILNNQFSMMQSGTGIDDSSGDEAEADENKDDAETHADEVNNKLPFTNSDELP